MLEAPRIPKKEKPEVTIANQEVQIENLLQRIEDLSSGRNEAVRQRLQFEAKAEGAESRLRQVESWNQAHQDHINGLDAKIARLESQIEGYRMAIKDICT